MSNFNVTLTVPVEALPALMTDLDVYDAALVSIEEAKPAPAPAPAPRAVKTVEQEVPSHEKHTSGYEVYSVACDLYRSTNASFRTSDVWHALRARGVEATQSSVGQHLVALRNMGLAEVVSGGKGPGGYFNVITRYLTEDEFEAEYRMYLYS